MGYELRPWAALASLCLMLTAAATADTAEDCCKKAPAAASVQAAASAEPAPSVDSTVAPARPQASAPASKPTDPVLAAFLGVIPLASGYYLTSTPAKGLIFTVGDAVLMGSIWNIRRDDKVPDRDVTPYFVLLAGVNALDAALSFWQARSDLRSLGSARLSVSLNPSGDPVVGLAWTF